MKKFSVAPGGKFTRITAAIEDDFDGSEVEDNYSPHEIDLDNDGFADKLEDVADTVEDIQDTVDDDDHREEDVNIDIENNISNHYIAECDKCKGIFISATVRSDQRVSSVTGECPLCGEETEQFLKWFVCPATEDDVVEVI